MSDPSSSFSRLDPIRVPVQDRQIEAISQKWVVLGGKVLFNSVHSSIEAELPFMKAAHLGGDKL
jgi:uncharacterized membrane protein